MDATYHGTERIFGRTRMRHEDVLLIIASRAAVELGSWNGYTYYLFYSPPNKDCKIAVTSDNHALLITVWEKSYCLPNGVTRVERALEQKARALLSTFILSKLKEHSQQGWPRCLLVAIDVIVKHHVVYTHSYENIRFERVTRDSDVLEVLMPALMHLAAAVEDHRTKADTHIRYGIRVKDPETLKPVRRYFTVGHERIMRRVPYAA